MHQEKQPITNQEANSSNATEYSNSGIAPITVQPLSQAQEKHLLSWLEKVVPQVVVELDKDYEQKQLLAQAKKQQL